MFNIFKQIKQLKMNKQELEQENANLNAALVRTNTANRELVDQLNKMDTELKDAITRVRQLDEQIRMMDAQKIAATRFNDVSKNY
jgi:chromosome segregation ATPase